MALCCHLMIFHVLIISTDKEHFGMQVKLPTPHTVETFNDNPQARIAVKTNFLTVWFDVTGNQSQNIVLEDIALVQNL